MKIIIVNKIYKNIASKKYDIGLNELKSFIYEIS